MGKRKKRKAKNKIKYSFFQKVKRYICPKMKVAFNLYDKYVTILTGYLPIVMFILGACIGVIGIVANKLYSPIVWLCTGYVLIFGIKNFFIGSLNQSKYSKGFKKVITIIKLMICFFSYPFIVTILSVLLKSVNEKILFVIPLVLWVVVKIFINIIFDYFFYNGFNKKTFYISLCSIGICLLINFGILLSVFWCDSLYVYLFVNFGIKRESVCRINLISFIVNIVTLGITFMQNLRINNWREIYIGKTLYRYNHIKGYVKQIYRESIGGIFIPILKYSSYKEIMNFNISVQWDKLANQLYKKKEPDCIDMMINNEFELNPLFRMYFVVKKWNCEMSVLFRYGYLILGIIFNVRGIQLFYDIKNPIDSQILILWGILLICLSTFGFIISIITREKYRKIKIILVGLILIRSIWWIILFFELYCRMIIFSALVLMYYSISFKFILGKVEENKKYKYF
ncbi:hypothetical protein [Clostridium butyricum]|uniref:hypothetical protein n=1 Tax=Clostridium butyricum TaxID=1492 RepID=UPI002AB2AF56|nr:hypothetical protein [Clostridium butyricum]